MQWLASLHLAPSKTYNHWEVISMHCVVPPMTVAKGMNPKVEMHYTLSISFHWLW